MTSDEILESIQDKDYLTYFSYVKMLKFFTQNAEVLSNYTIGFDQASETVDEEKKEADVILKFSDKYDQYYENLMKYRDKLSPEKRTRAEKEVKFQNQSGASAEEMIFKK
jgi:hypothetical protein